jgi:hypothetical protein
VLSDVAGLYLKFKFKILFPEEWRYEKKNFLAEFQGALSIRFLQSANAYTFNEKSNRVMFEAQWRRRRGPENWAECGRFQAYAAV